MSVKIDPVIDSLIWGTVVSSLDKIGINPMLVLRHASGLLAPMAAGIVKQASGQNLASTIEELVKQINVLLKDAQTADADKTELFYSNGVITMNAVDCVYMPTVHLGKSLGYKACPLCMQAFMLSVYVKIINVAEIENFEVEYKGDTCTVKIKLIEK